MDGIGIYARRLGTKVDGGPIACAQRAADHGVRTVAIMGCWQEPRGGSVRTGNPNKGVAARYIEQLKKRGIACWLWGYPWGGGHEAFVKAMRETADDGIEGWLLDPELGFKWGAAKAPKVPLGETDLMRQKEAIPGTPSGTQAIRRRQATALMDASMGVLGSRKIGVTSYGRARFHPNLPWREFSCPIGSPQLYTAGPDSVDAGIREWRDHGFDIIVPSVGAFGARSGSKMHEHLSTFVDGKEDVRGFMVWSWQQLDQQEWKILARWAGWFDRGIVAASTCR